MQAGEESAREVWSGQRSAPVLTGLRLKRLLGSSKATCGAKRNIRTSPLHIPTMPSSIPVITVPEPSLTCAR
jgi:hypothetical protein